MDFQEALKRSRDEGILDPRVIPWDLPDLDPGKSKITGNIQMPPQLMMLNDDVIDDFQKTIENIRIESETKSWQVIGVCSAVSKQGTSTFSAILALIMAAIEQKSLSQLDMETFKSSPDEIPKPGVLLIDAQLRNPSLHKKFEVNKRGGLIEILEDEIPFKKAVKKIKNSSLKFISVGENKNFNLSPHHLAKIKAYLNVLKHKIQFVLLDIPPILQYSEGIALSKLCDGIIMVVEAGETRWEVIQQAKRQLTRANVNLVGGIINKRKFYISSWVYKSL